MPKKGRKQGYFI